MPYIDRFSCSRPVFATLPIVIFGACAPLELDSSDENGHSDAAPELLFYGAMGEACCGEDPHPVHGISAPDGSFILGGKSIDGNGNSDGFIVKIGPTLPTGMAQLDEDNEVSFAWSDTFGVDGKQDAVNAVAASEDAVWVAGLAYATDMGIRATLHKHHLDTGAQIWTTHLPARHRVEPAFESIVLTPEGGTLGGLKTANRGRLKDLNPTETRPVVVQIALQFGATQRRYGTQRAAMGRYLPRPRLDSHDPPRRQRGLCVPSSDTRRDLHCRTPRPKSKQDVGNTVKRARRGDGYHGANGCGGRLIGFAITGHKGLNGGGIDGSVTHLDAEGTIQWATLVGNPVGGTGEFEGFGGGNPNSFMMNAGAYKARIGRGRPRLRHRN